MAYRNCVLFALLALLAAAPASAQWVVAEVEVGRAPLDVVYDPVNDKVFVSSEATGTVKVINPQENAVVATIPAGTNPGAMCLNSAQGKLYVANNILAQSGTVTIIDCAGDSVLATVNVGRAPRALAINTTHNKVYCINRESANITIIDGDENIVLGTVWIEDILNDVLYNPTNDYLYVVTGGYRVPGKLWVIDCSADTLVYSFSVGTNAVALSYNPQSNYVYVASSASDNMTVVNCANHSVRAQPRTGDEPHSVLWTTQNNSKVFCTSYWGQRVHYMHGDSTRFSWYVELPGSPEKMLHNPETQHLFVSQPLASQVAVIDARDRHNALLDNINVGGGPTPMALDPGRDQVYVANSWGSTVTVIKDVVGIAEKPGVSRPGGIARVEARPNPVRPRASVLLRADGFTPERVEMWNAVGQLVHAGPAGTEVSVPAPAASGLYFYALSDDAGSVTGKLIVD